MKSRAFSSEREGYTLVEVLVAMVITGMLIAGAVASLWQIQQLWVLAETELLGTGQAALALQKMVSGSYDNPGLRMAVWDASVPTPRVVQTNGGPHRIEFTHGENAYFYEYDGHDAILDQDGVVICDSVTTPFSFSIHEAGVVKIDLGLYRSGTYASQRYIRLATWVALRNR